MTGQAALLEAIAKRDELQARTAAAALDVSYRMLALRDEDGMSGVALAELLGISHQRIYQVLARAKADVAKAEMEWRERQAASYGMASAGRDANRGLESGSHPCFSCGRFKSRPSSVCGHCGDDPVTFGGDRREFDRAYGYAGVAA